MAEAGTGGPPLISCTAVPKKLLGGLVPPLVGHWGATPYFMYRRSIKPLGGLAPPLVDLWGASPYFMPRSE